VTASRLEVLPSAWIAARCTSRLPHWSGSVQNVGYSVEVGAHTSPVYIVAGDERLFDTREAAYILALLDVGQTWLDTLATPASPERHARARHVFDEARDRLRHLHRLHDSLAHPGVVPTTGMGEPVP
jgi:hypothetical protein